MVKTCIMRVPEVSTDSHSEPWQQDNGEFCKRLTFSETCLTGESTSDDVVISDSGKNLSFLYPRRFNVYISALTSDTTTILLLPFYVSRHPELRTGGFRWSKVLLPACLADANQRIRIRNNTLEFSSTVLPAPPPCHHMSALSKSVSFGTCVTARDVHRCPAEEIRF